MGVAQVERDRAGAEVPAAQLHAALRAHGSAQGEDARDERQLAESDTVDEILASPIDRVADFDHVLAVLSEGVAQHGIGIETKVIGEGQFVSRGIADGHVGLKPAGHGIGQIGDQALAQGEQFPDVRQDIRMHPWRIGRGVVVPRMDAKPRQEENELSRPQRAYS